MKKLLTIVTLLLMTLSAEAQVKPTVLGDKHAMLKVKHGEKYLLLPGHCRTERTERHGTATERETGY